MGIGGTCHSPPLPRIRHARVVNSDDGLFALAVQGLSVMFHVKHLPRYWSVLVVYSPTASSW